MSKSVGRSVLSLADSQVVPRDDVDCALLEVPAGAACRVEFPDGPVVLVLGRGVVELPVGGPYRLTVDCGPGDSVVVDDVLVGDIWALAGQSNMAGAGQLDPHPEPVAQARMLSFDGQWKPALEPLHRLWSDGETVVRAAARRLFHPQLSHEDWQAVLEQVDSLEGPRVGPGAAFAGALAAATGVPIGLLPCALGATSLDMWAPDAEPGLDRDETLYGNLVLRARRFGPVRGVLWYQGEGDTGPGLGDTYEARFGAWVAALRSDLGNPRLPVVAAQICRYDLPQLKRVLDLDVDPVTTPGWSAVRDAMRRVGDTVPNVSVVATADLGLVDGIHLDRDAQELLGRRFAAVASGRRPPRLASVARHPDGSRVVCRFDDVVEGLRMDGPCDFAIGCTGEPAQSVVVEGCDTVVVDAGAPLRADTTITYGPGLNPRAGLRDGLLAVPLFGPLPVP